MDINIDKFRLLQRLFDFLQEADVARAKAIDGR